MSTTVSASVREFGRGTHTIEFAPLAAVEETAVAEADLLQRLDFLDLMSSVRMKMTSKSRHTLMELSSHDSEVVFMVATDIASSLGSMASLVLIGTGILVL